MTPGEWSSAGEHVEVWPGRDWPLGATWSEESTNFAVRAPDATALWVCLFDEDGSETRHALTERSLGTWHGALPGLAAGTAVRLPGGRALGPRRRSVVQPAQAAAQPLRPGRERRDGSDPAVFGFVKGDDGSDDLAVRDERDSAPYVGRSVVVHDTFDWGDDQKIGARWRDSVVYELHVKGYAELHDRIPEELRGTYAGLGRPVVIDYLRDLGVTAVELLPVHMFVSEQRLAADGLKNYWGYNSLAYFAPDAAYSSSGDRGQQVTEFKQMVKNLHAAGIEVLLDVVYNHTAEAGVRRTDAVLPGARRRRLLQAGLDRPGGQPGTGHLLGRHRVRQHGRCREPGGSAPDPRLVALLGHRDARLGQ